MMRTIDIMLDTFLNIMKTVDPDFPHTSFVDLS